jgi:LPXTG-site transpeptidase (sortase) family protein
MSLKVNNLRHKITKSLGILGLITFIALFAILVRNEYYLDKDRQPRAASSDQQSTMTTSPEQVDEEEVTVEQKIEHVVAPSKPRYLSVTRLGIDKARIMEVNVLPDNKLGTPLNIFDIGWYNASGLPGRGGAMLMDAHNGGPTKDGVFKRLNQMVVGDEIVVERGDGAIFTFEVIENRIMTIAEADSFMSSMLVSAIDGREGLNLITCTGDWIQNEQTYNKRVMLRAVLK